jgi:xylan 1,4-beta-xylosidase
VQVAISDVPSKKVTITQYQIDDKHSNSYEVWKAMGSPQNPTATQIKTLEKAGQLEQISSNIVSTKNGTIDLTVDLPRQAVSFLKLTWK